MAQRNTLERRAMLAARAEAQVSRVPGFTPMVRKPRGYVGKTWNPAGVKRLFEREVVDG